MIIVLLVLVIIAALSLAAFCAGAETGFLSVSRGRILHMARSGSIRAKIIHDAISNIGRTTTALLVGNNLASVSYSSACAALISAIFKDSSLATAIGSAVAAIVVLYFGEFAPKLLCVARPLRRMLQLSPIWRWFSLVFVPVGALVQAIIGRMLPKSEAKSKLTPDVVLRILEDRKDGVRLSDLESALIARILVLRSKGEFITPESLLSAIDEGMV